MWPMDGNGGLYNFAGILTKIPTSWRQESHCLWLLVCCAKRVEPCSAMSRHVPPCHIPLGFAWWAFSVAMCRLPTAFSSSSNRQSHGFCTTQMLRQLGCRFVVFCMVLQVFPWCAALSQSAVWPVGQLRKTCPLAAWAGQGSVSQARQQDGVLLFAHETCQSCC